MTANLTKTRVRVSIHSACLTAIAAGLLSTPAAAGKTSYGYDALGRLALVEQKSARNSYRASYTYDKASNRTRYEVTRSGVTSFPIVARRNGKYWVTLLRQR